MPQPTFPRHRESLNRLQTPAVNNTGYFNVFNLMIKIQYVFFMFIEQILNNLTKHAKCILPPKYTQFSSVVHG